MKTKTEWETFTIKTGKGKKETTLRIKEGLYEQTIFPNSKYAYIYNRIESLRPGIVLSINFNTLRELKALRIQLYKTMEKYDVNWQWRTSNLTIQIWKLPLPQEPLKSIMSDSPQGGIIIMNPRGELPA